jgi:predicted tellurium resistance membrane protein TerC
MPPTWHSKGMLYFAMGFSVFVEAINIRVRRHEPVQLHEPYAAPKENYPV